MSNFFNMWKTNKSSGDKNAASELSSIANNNNDGSVFDDADSNWLDARAKTERMSVSRSGRYKERLRRRSSLFDGTSKMAADEEEEQRPSQQLQQKYPHANDSSTARVHSRSGSNSSNNSQKKAENNENINDKAKVSVSYNAANQRASIDRTQNAGQSVSSHNKDLPLQSVAI